ncbi:MAG: agmatine deiminase family protein [Bacteroidota bacterium]
MKLQYLIFFVFGLFVCCTDGPKQDSDKSLTFRIPGEFEPHEAIWLGFSTSESNHETDTVTIDIIKALIPNVKLNLIIENDSLFSNGKEYFHSRGLDTSRINLVFQNPTDVWYRDPGPIFGITPNNELAIADFKYTNYQNVRPDSIGERAREHEGIDRDIAERLGIATVVSEVAMEGGSFETNGKGVLIQVEDITLRRNPHLTKVEIESDFKKNFGIEKVIWLPSGVADDPHNFDRISGNIFGYGTGGHSDEFVRFANDSTILISWVEEKEKDKHPINGLNYEVLSKNYNILSKATDNSGKKFKVIKVPHPDPRTYEMVVAPYWAESDFWQGIMEKFKLSMNDTIKMAYATSYLNYIVTNNTVVIPQYGSISKDTINLKDEKVKEILTKVFPKRNIIGINPISFNQGGGGMHCRYQTQPEVK